MPLLSQGRLGWFHAGAASAMPAHESEHLRKTVDPVELAAMRTGFLDRRHLHHDPMDVRRRDYGPAFIAAVFSGLADDLHQAAAAVCAEFFVGDDGQRHRFK